MQRMRDLFIICLQDRIIRAHEFGVKMFRYDSKMQLAVTVGVVPPNPREVGASK